MNPLHNPDEAQKQTILVVDDNAADRRLMSYVLADEGYRVLEADSGEAGLSVFKQHLNEIHLIVTDIYMPGMDGVEFIQNVRRLSSSPKVIFTSGYKPRLAVESEQHLAEFIEKSPDTVRFLQKVREVLDKKGSFMNVLNMVFA